MIPPTRMRGRLALTRAAGLLTAAAGVLIGASAPVSAQQVRYYHLDAIGNVRAITDAGGTVVERHDYLPFGEECTTGGCATNAGLNAGGPRKFTGKERDTETGFDYFGARYYGSKIGRFTTVDPAYVLQENLVDPQRWNRYAYALNNPFRYIDPDGRWPIKVKQVHQASVDRTLSSLPAEDRQALKAAQVAMDENQSSTGAPTHAMRAPGQSVEQARAQANEFVRSELEQAKNLEAAGAHLSAMDHLGNAMHTLQDATSPAHEGFQVWDEKWDSVWSGEGRGHVQKEFYDPGKGSSLDRATQRSYDYFTGKRDLPKDFFSERE